MQPVIEGIQSQKVVANAKHYILNNQETNRQAVSAETDERTRFEIYYPPFEAAVRAGAALFGFGGEKKGVHRLREVCDVASIPNSLPVFSQKRTLCRARR